MKSCAIALAVDGTEDELISCFKEGKNVKQQEHYWNESKMRLFTDNKLHKDRFQISPEDTVDATPLNIINEEDDDDIDIVWILYY